MMHIRKGTLPKYLWGRRFLAFSNQMLSSAKEGNWKSNGGMLVFPVPKSHADRSAKEFRLVCSFESLDDRIFWSLVSRYLRDAFESVAYPCVHAFRPHKSSNTAGEQIVRYVRQKENTQFWAAKVDVIALFDSIEHAVVLSSLQTCKTRMLSAGVALDARAETLVRNYLSLYARNPFSVAIGMRLIGATSRSNLLRLTTQTDSPVKNTERNLSGIPQGGPLSPVLSNIVLHFADERVLTASDPDLLYLRYCDNALFCHPTVQGCEAARLRFCDGLATQGLRPHSPSLSTPSKSTPPFSWAPTNRGGTEWLSFLGYDFRADGAVRLSESTIQDLVRRLRRKKSQMIAYFEKRPSPKPDSMSSLGIYMVIRHTFIAAIFGRTCAWRMAIQRPFPKLNRNQLSWAGAFRLISRNRSAELQLRHLDRHLESSISSCFRRLAGDRRITVSHRSAYVKLCRSVNCFNLCGIPFAHSPSDLEKQLSSFPHPSLPPLKQVLIEAQSSLPDDLPTDAFIDYDEDCSPRDYTEFSEFEYAGLSGEEAVIAWDNTH